MGCHGLDMEGEQILVVDIREETKQSDAELASIAELMGGGEEVTINE